MRAYLAIAFDWLCILSALALAAKLQSTLAYLVAILVVAARQHALLILVHEGAHSRLHPNAKANDLISNLFCAFPFGVSVSAYRAGHLRHHRYNMDRERDPDLIFRYGDDDWVFPKSKTTLALDLAKILFGGGIFHYGRGLRNYLAIEEVRKEARDIRFQILKNACTIAFIASMVAVFGAKAFLICWVLPFFTVLQFLLRLRSIAEHWGLKLDSEMTRSRNTQTNALCEFFIAPHSVSLHLTHHLYPAIPFYRLKQAHRRLLANETYRKNASETDGYIFGRRSVISELTA